MVDRFGDCHCSEYMAILRGVGWRAAVKVRDGAGGMIGLMKVEEEKGWELESLDGSSELCHRVRKQQTAALQRPAFSRNPEPRQLPDSAALHLKAQAPRHPALPAQGVIDSRCPTYPRSDSF